VIFESKISVMRGGTSCQLAIAVIFLGHSGVTLALKLLELDVPTHKLVGEGVKLVCRFDMEGDTLYSVKWYRNEQEFYRFVPNDRPKLQIFPQHGIRVERSKSSRQHVFLFDLQLEASGSYRCEVSAEAPSFRTKHEEKVMVVVQEPHHNQIVGLKPRYYTGDLVNVTCYSKGSSPPAELSWKVNDAKIYDEGSALVAGDSGQYQGYQGEGVRGYPGDDGGYPDSGDTPHYARYTQTDTYNRNSRYEQDVVGTEYQVIQPQVAEPKLVFGTIKDWFEKHESNTNLDTAASNLQFYVQDIHRHIGLRLECTASIGPVYWHATQETCQVAAKPRELPQWMSSDTYKGSYPACLLVTLVVLVLLLGDN